MKITIDPKVRQPVEAIAAELSALLKTKAERDDEIALYPEFVEKLRAEQAELNHKFQIGRPDDGKRLAEIRETLEQGHIRIKRLRWMETDETPGYLALIRQAVPIVASLAAVARDAVVADVKEKLIPVFGKDEASRLAEYSTPVRILNDMIRSGFDDGSRESDAFWAKAKRMCAFVSAVLAGEWDPFKWRKQEDVMRFLNISHD